MSVSTPFLHRRPPATATAASPVSARALISAAVTTWGDLGHRRRGHRPQGAGTGSPLDLDRDRLHELRATVAGLAASHRLLHEHRLPEEKRQRLERLHDSELSRLQRLLDDHQESALAPVDLQAAVEPIVESLRARGHTVRGPSTTARALGRPDDVVEILHVLLDNAAQHGSGDIEVSIVDYGRYAEVWISDDGPGVSDEVLPRIFQRGARGRDSTGEGIGLNIAHRRAQHLGGWLRLAPPPPRGRGADFVLALPTCSDQVTCPDSPR